MKERYEPGAPDRKDLLVSKLHVRTRRPVPSAHQNQGAFVRSGISEGACLSETLFAMTAGSDTTASAIRSTMLHLITNHRVYYKLKQEVRKAVSEGVVSKPIKISEAKKLLYLRVCSAGASSVSLPHIEVALADAIIGCHIRGTQDATSSTDYVSKYVLI